MVSIFVQIPAYRDFELPTTIQDAIDNASGNYRIVFGIHLCKKPEDNISLDSLKLKDFTEIRYVENIAPIGIGVQLSRYIANELYLDEDYYLQTDSHMKFQSNWDELAISDYTWYKNLGIANPLISMYPPNYSYLPDGSYVRDDIEISGITRVSFRENPMQFKSALLPSQLAVTAPVGCHYTASIAAGMIFTSGEYAKIKPNMKVAFWGEEILIAARAFTHGFDLVTARNPIVWHLYHSGQPFNLVKRHHAWQDWPELWKKFDLESKQEVYRILNTAAVGPEALGDRRTLDDFGIFSGLNFKTREITRII